jgi:hypothetical protein
MTSELGDDRGRKLRHGSADSDDRCTDDELSDTEGGGNASSTVHNEATRTYEEQKADSAVRDRRPQALRSKHFLRRTSLLARLDDRP